MENKINVYIIDYIDTMLSFIKYSNKINIILTPEYYMKNSKSYVNYDAVLHLDGATSENNELIFKCKTLNIPYLGIPRLNKLQQTLFLNENNINTPDTFYCNINNINDICSLIDDTNTMYILKIDTGARGLGQALLSYWDLIALYETENHILDIIYDEQIKKQQISNKIFNDDILQIEEEKNNTKLEAPEPEHNEIKLNYNTNSEYSQLEQLDQYNKLKNIKWNMHSNLISGIKNGYNLILQKYIKNRLEYRIIWFYDGEPIIIKRNLNANSWQANACNNDSDSSYYLTDSYDDIPEKKLFYSYVDIKHLNSVFNKLNTPFLSIDIYIDTDTNKFGIFEFQMEFGWTKTLNFPYNLVQTNIENSILKLVNKKPQ